MSPWFDLKRGHQQWHSKRGCKAVGFAGSISARDKWASHWELFWAVGAQRKHLPELLQMEGTGATCRLHSVALLGCITQCKR